MASVDWELIGVQLLERERRPVLLLDLDGCVLKANRAFLFLLPDGTRTQQVNFREEWLRESSRSAFDRALGQATRGERPQVTVSLINTLFPVDLVLELCRVGTREVPTVMAVMIDAVSREPSLPLAPAAGVTYEVLLGPDASWQVTRATSAGAHGAGATAGAPCWKRMFNRESECPVCPVRSLGALSSATVVTGADAGAQQTVLVAERRGDAAVVTAFPIDADVFSAMMNSRIDTLARGARLSPREREVFWLLLLGRSVEEVATATGITERTAKFHQQNLLRKLGADSRVGLLRLLL